MFTDDIALLNFEDDLNNLNVKNVLRCVNDCTKKKKSIIT